MTNLTKEQVEKVTNFLAILIKLSVKAAINEQGYFSIENEQYIDCDDEDEEESGYYVGEGDRFSQQIECRYQVQIENCYQNEAYSSEHNICIELKGHLAENFKKYGIDTKFDVWMNNYDGEPRQSITNIDRFEKDLFFPSNHSLVTANLDNFDVFYEEITKPFTFEILRM